MNEPSLKKRGPLLFISGASCIIVMLAILLLVFSPNGFSKSGQKVADAKEEKSEIETKELQAPFKGIQLFAESYNAARTTYILEYPQVEDDTFNETILHFINSEKATFLSLAENHEHLSKNGHSSLTTTVDTYQFNDRFYSFTFHIKTDFGANDKSTRVTAFMYDAQKAQLVTFENLLKSNLRYLETFRLYAQQQLQANDTLSASLLDEDMLKEALSLDWGSYTNFTIEDNQLVVYFQPGEVTDATQGVVSVTADMSYLNSIVADAFKSDVAKNTKTLPLVKDNRKRVAITFDDGPHAKVTQQILDTLDEFDAKATFFMLGKNATKYPEIVQEVNARGHEIGNHSWSHPQLTKLSLDAANDEYTRTEAALIDAIGEGATVFRPPYGNINDRIKAEIPVLSVNWTIDTLDWKHRNSTKILTILKSHMHNNAVVLMHDIHQSTADGLRAVLHYLQSEGYEFVTVSEIMPYEEIDL